MVFPPSSEHIVKRTTNTFFSSGLVLPITDQECPLWWGIPRSPRGEEVMIREWEGELWPDLEEELI